MSSQHPLHRPLLHSIKYRGAVFLLRPSFDRVLKLFELYADPDISELDKAKEGRRLIVPLSPLGALEPAFEALIGKSERSKEKQKTVDFLQDADLIYAGFMQAYGVDLYKQQGRLHWWNFIQLFNGLPDDTKIAQVISIRSQEIPKPNGHNADEIQRIMKLKQAVALDQTQEEREQQLQAGLARLFNRLYAEATGE